MIQSWVTNILNPIDLYRFLMTIGSPFFVPFRRPNLAFGSLNSFVGDESNEILKYLLNPNRFQPSDWPLVLFGSSGTGKTELAFTIAEFLNDDTGNKPLNYSGTDFARSYLSAIETDSVQEFRSRLVKSNGLILDQIDEFSRFPKAQLELIQVVGRFQSKRLPLVMTASDQFFSSSRILPQLMSRLSAGLTLPVNPPGKNALKVIIEQLAEIYDIKLADSATDFLLTKFNVTVPKVNQFFKQFSTSKPNKKLVTKRVLASYFKNSLAADVNQVVQDYLKVIALEFGIRSTDIVGQSRKLTATKARSLSAYLLRERLNLSFAKIGKHLGNRDHSTIMHACNKISEVVEHQSSVEFIRRISKIEQQLNELTYPS